MVRDQLGAEAPVLAGFWKSENNFTLLAQGSDAIAKAADGTVVRGDVYVLRPAPGGAQQTAASNRQLDGAPALTKAAGGAKAKYDWEGAAFELCRLEMSEGTKAKTQADIVRHLQGWFMAQPPHQAPDVADLKRRAKRFETMRDAI